jgi:hypothetical protein
VAFATGIASVLGTLFGGVIVDRIGGRRTAIVADALSLVTVLALVVALFADFVPLAERGTLLVAAVMFAAALVLIAGPERQRLTHDQPMTWAGAVGDVGQGFRFIVTEPLLGPLTFLLVAWVAVYVPLSTLIFPAWFNFAGESAGALGVLLGAQALGGVLGGLVFAAVGPRVSRFWWFVPTEVAATAGLAALLATEPGAVVAVALSFVVGLVAAGSLPIINTACYSHTPERLLGRVNGTSFAMVLAVLPCSSLAFGWLINATRPSPWSWRPTRS